MVVDSSVWLEILRDGPLRDKCQKVLHRQSIKVPTLVLFEVYKKIKMKISEEVGLEAVASLCQYQVVDLTREVALLAADLAIEHELAMADSLVLAHATLLGETLATLDNDFRFIHRVTVIC